MIPDILANAGGVTGSYFEWAQNIQQFPWKEERFNAELADKLHAPTRPRPPSPRRTAAPCARRPIAIGIERVARASRLRGYI